MEIERLLEEIRREHADFMSYLGSEGVSDTARKMDAFVTTRLTEVPKDREAQLALAAELSQYIEHVLEDAMELVNCRSMLRTLSRYDMAAENLLFELTNE